MNNKPTFSIVTCTWNSAATLGDTLDSIRRQSCQDVEHIFVDGGSTDGTLAMLDAYEGRKLILRDVRGGISRAMNEGIRAASGEIVAHLHSDDYDASPDVLDTVARHFQTESVDWVFGNIQVLKDGALQPAYRMQPFTFASFVAGKASVPHPAVFIRRTVFDKVGLFDEQLKYSMDIDLWLRLGQVAQPALVDQPLTVFRDHAGSVSSANKIKARREEFQVRRKYMNKAPLAFGVFCMRYFRRMRMLQRAA
jgi:glycosyltransferase involved in cell wall biosynthesis